VDVIALSVLGLAPGVVLLWFYYKKDKLEPEPKWFVIRMFLLGGLAAIPAGLAELPLMRFPMLSMVVVAPVLEETLKFLVVRQTIYRHAEFDEPMDGIVYAAAVALGFASMENVLYLFTASHAPEQFAPVLAQLDPSLMVGATFAIRALLSVPGHALWSTIWGYALGRAKFMEDRRLAARVVGGALVISWVVHGLHNLLASLSLFVGIAGLAALGIVLWWWVTRSIAAALRDSPFHPERIVQAVADEFPGNVELAHNTSPIDPVP